LDYSELTDPDFMYLTVLFWLVGHNAQTVVNHTR